MYYRGDTVSKNLTNEEFLNKFKLLKGEDFEVLSEYKAHREKMKFKHIKCGTIFEATANNMLHPEYGGCPICGAIKRNESRKNTYDKIFSKLEEIYYPKKAPFYIDTNQYYKNNKEKIKVVCTKCGNTFMCSPSNIMHGRGCPICNRVRANQSKRVTSIIDFLETKGFSNKTEDNLHYVLEYTFDDCVCVKPLRFDIALFKNNTLIGLIEYDGEFHDRIHWKDSRSNIEDVKHRDTIKNNYCLNHNIPLLRINYKNFKNYKTQILNFISK